MSDNIFPELTGLSWSRSKSPVMSTNIQTSTSGKEKRAVYYTYPRWKFSLTYEMIKDDGTVTGDLQQIVGFFNNVYGSFDDWLFKDWDDYSVTDQAFGTGDGTTVAFQLLRSFGQFVEPVRGIVSTPTIYVNSVPITSFTFSTLGLITFDNPPAASAALQWTGNFYYRCRFLSDSYEFEEFVSKLWTLKTLDFISVK